MRMMVDGITNQIDMEFEQAPEGEGQGKQCTAVHEVAKVVYD